MNIERKTTETQITLQLDLRGNGENTISTGLGFLDHMLNLMAFHAGWSLDVQAVGDLHVDDHHLVEDVAIVLGRALSKAIQGYYDCKKGLARYGQWLMPMDETMVMIAIDLCNRPHFVCDLEFRREQVGGLSTEMVPHFFQTLCSEARMTMHIKQFWSKNTHHLVEATFKGTGRALGQALTPTDRLPSTKGAM